jgi:hypothetical protein
LASRRIDFVKDIKKMIGPNLPAYSFNRSSILINAPSASGVYAIFNLQNWIYIGESSDVQARLLDHLNGDPAWITSWNPDSFQFEYCLANQRVARQDQLILQLNPLCTT